MIVISAAAKASPPQSDDEPQERQHRADVEISREHLYRFGETPSGETVDRLVAYARSHADDAAALFWAGYSARCSQSGITPVESWEFTRRSADLSYPEAMTSLGRQYLIGADNSGDMNSGMELLRRAAALADGSAIDAMGDVYALGKGVPKNLETARSYFAESLSHGYFPAAEDLSVALNQLGRVPESDATAQRAADLGDVRTMRGMVQYLERGDKTGEKSDRALMYLRRGSLWGDPTLMRMYANAMAAGLFNLDQDGPLIHELLMRAAQGGDYFAQVGLAYTQSTGTLGARKESERGLRMLERLSRRGDPSGHAQYYLGLAIAERNANSDASPQVTILMTESARCGDELARAWLEKEGKPVPVTQPSTSPTTLPAFGPESEEDQTLDDRTEFADWESYESPPAREQTIRRMIVRARGPRSDPRDLTYAAFAAVQGRASDVSPVERKEWLETASQHGDPLAMAIYGQELLSSSDGPGGAGKGLGLLRKSADRGDALGIYYLGAAYVSGAPGLARDSTEGLALVKRAASLGVGRAYRQLAEHDEKAGDRDKALNDIKEGAFIGDGWCMAHLAQIVTGQIQFGGVTETYDIRKVWTKMLLRSAIWGNPEAMTMVATRLAKVGPPDPNLSRHLLFGAATRGSVDAEAILARAHVTGEFAVALDPDRGITDLETLASPAFNNAEAKWQLGQLLCEAIGVAADPVRGYALIAEAAQQGHPLASQWLPHRAQ